MNTCGNPSFMPNILFWLWKYVVESAIFMKTVGASSRDFYMFQTILLLCEAPSGIQTEQRRFLGHNDLHLQLQNTRYWFISYTESSELVIKDQWSYLFISVKDSRPLTHFEWFYCTRGRSGRRRRVTHQHNDTRIKFNSNSYSEVNAKYAANGQLVPHN